MNHIAAYDASFMHNLSIIAQDEKRVQRLVKYVSRLAHTGNCCTKMPDEDLKNRIDKADKDFHEGRTFTMLPDETFENFRSRIGR
ncbi:MAG: hypothetical protein IJ775_05350 [Muribaculaceae bacterium]|nr:hypothetical protein [Muribaculaceae bacterium]